MLFNSLTYFIFLTIVFLLYWYPLRKNRIGQNVLLLVASYVFYGWWDWRFLSLMLISSAIDYFTGIRIHEANNTKNRKLYLWISLISNLGMLGLFKYFNFFIESFTSLSLSLGFPVHASTINIILPVGISFYTFQTMSYSIDIFRRQLTPVKDPVAFFAFVSFFPQLVAGPIERASALLPQFLTERQFDRDSAKDGLRQILWGLIKKVVIADALAIPVDQIFGNHDYASMPSYILLSGAVFFSFQLYCDFSGYSDIAIGTARLFGFRLMQNFALPFFSRNIAELWQRWHISLSTWFKDYVFIPLGGNRVSKWRHIINIFITFLLSGVWHGANWTFVIWGGLHALFYVPIILFKHNIKHTDIVASGKYLPNLKEAFQMTKTFGLFAFSMIFFRAETVDRAFLYIKSLILNYYNWSEIINHTMLFWPAKLIGMLLIVEWIQRERMHVLEVGHLHSIIRWLAYLFAIWMFIYYGQFDAPNSFIYFQF
jgi:alginate O-acetyltransferase complex protein AlgI